jgi:hypothetical protein
MKVAMAPASVKIFAGVIISPPPPEESLGKTPELMIATIL